MKKFYWLVMGSLLCGSAVAEWTFDSTFRLESDTAVVGQITDGNWRIAVVDDATGSYLKRGALFLKMSLAGSGDLDFGDGIVADAVDATKMYTIKYISGYYKESPYKDHQPTGVVRLPPTLESLGCSAFKECAGITEVIVHAPQMTVMDWNGYGGYQFYKCTGLTNVVFDAPHMETMPGRMFGGCSALKNLSLNAPNLKVFGQACFFNAGLTNDVSTIVPRSAQDLGVNAFSSCSIAGDLVLTNCTFLRTQVFSSAKKITSVTVTGGATAQTLFNNQLFHTLSSCTSFVLRSTCVTDLSKQELFYNCVKTQRVELDMPALRTLDGKNTASDMFLNVGKSVGGFELTLTASNLVTIGTSLKASYLTNAVMYGSCPGTTAMTNLFSGISENYACRLTAPRQAQFGWRAQATALTEAERAMATCPEGAYGTWTNGNGVKIWMVHVESPYYRPDGMLMIIR